MVTTQNMSNVQTETDAYGNTCYDLCNVSDDIFENTINDCMRSSSKSVFVKYTEAQKQKSYRLKHTFYSFGTIPGDFDGKCLGVYAGNAPKPIMINNTIPTLMSGHIYPYFRTEEGTLYVVYVYDPSKKFVCGPGGSIEYEDIGKLTVSSVRECLPFAKRAALRELEEEADITIDMTKLQKLQIIHALQYRKKASFYGEISDFGWTWTYEMDKILADSLVKKSCNQYKGIHGKVYLIENDRCDTCENIPYIILAPIEEKTVNIESKILPTSRLTRWTVMHSVNPEEYPEMPTLPYILKRFHVFE